MYFIKFSALVPDARMEERQVKLTLKLALKLTPKLALRLASKLTLTLALELGFRLALKSADKTVNLAGVLAVWEPPEGIASGDWRLQPAEAPLDRQE